MSVVEKNRSITGQPKDLGLGGLGAMKAWAEDVERRANGGEGHGQDTCTRSSRCLRGWVEEEEEVDAGQEEEEASLNDVQEALKRNFVNTGVIDNVTARLRRQFILELRRKGLGVPGASEAVTARCRPVAGMSLRERILNSLVVDHLTSNGLLQSLAVFLPESGLEASATAAPTATATAAATASDGQDRDAAGRFMTAALSREDILRGLPVPSESALFRRVIRRVESGGAVDLTGVAATEESPWEQREGGAVGESHEQERRVCGLLNALLVEIAARSSAVAVDTNTQTDEPGRSHKENLVMRLEGVREAWLKRAADERREPARDVTERMLGFQRDCEARAAAQLKTELEIFKERELSSLRLQMAATQRRELDATRKDLQAKYDARVEGLEEAERERERRNVERLRNAEASQFEARQNLLRELDLLRAREEEIRRGAELDARAIRSEELRLRDLATSLEARSEEIRRREREGVRAREAALEAVKHEARQALEVREEGVAQEREFLRQEMGAVRAERKACQEQLSQHAETARALQEARSEALAQEARAAALEADAERAAEQMAVYREAYETNREVAKEGDRAYVRLGRAELEMELCSAKASLEESRGRHAEAMQRAVEGRDACGVEVKRLWERERLWEKEATELRHALASVEIDKDRAEQRADDTECERTALEAQVEALTIALRRSRDAIDAIRLCDAEAEASSWAAPGVTTAFDSRINPISAFPTAADGVPESVETIAGGTALGRKRVGVSTSPPPSCESWHGRPSGPMSSAGGGALDRWSFDDGRDWGLASAVVATQEDGGCISSSLVGATLVDDCAREMEHKRRQQKQKSALSCRGGWNDDSGAGGGATAAARHAARVRAGSGRGPRGRRSRRDVRGNDMARNSCSVSGSSRSMLFDDCSRPSRSRLCDEEEEISRGCCRRSEKSSSVALNPGSGIGRGGGGGDVRGGSNKRVEAAECLLEAETERMAQELEKRASFCEREAVREEDRRREREADRVLREEAEVHAMRMRLAEEEDKAAMAKAATTRLLKESRVIERRETPWEEGGSSWVILMRKSEERLSAAVVATAEKAKMASKVSVPGEVIARSATEQTSMAVAVQPIECFNMEESLESNNSREEGGHKGCVQIAAEKREFPDRCGGASLEDGEQKPKEVLSAAAATAAKASEVLPREALTILSTKQQASRARQPQPAIPLPGSPTASATTPETTEDHAVAAHEVPPAIGAAKDEDLVQLERKDTDGPFSKVGGDTSPSISARATSPPVSSPSREREQHRDLGATAAAEADGAGDSKTREGEGGAENAKPCVDEGGGGSGGDSGDDGIVEEVEKVDASSISKAEADLEVEAYREKVRQRRQQHQQQPKEHGEAADVLNVFHDDSNTDQPDAVAAAAVGVAGIASQRRQGQWKQRQVSRGGSVSEISQTSAGAGGTYTGTTVELEVGGNGEVEAGRTTEFDSDCEYERRDLDGVGDCRVEASSVSGGEGSGMFEGSTGVESVISGGGSEDNWF